METNQHSRRGWLPFRLRGDGETARLDWCKVGDEAFTNSFFDQTIEQHLRDHPQAVGSTPLEALLEPNGTATPSPRGALIFHLSRCGSTLVSRTLSTCPRLSVFSEPSIVEALLRHSRNRPRAETEELLLGLVKAFSACHEKKGVVLKLAARAVDDAELFAAALPEMARVFVYRDPVEVLVSLVGSRSEKLPPGLETAGLLPDSPEVLRRLSPAEFWARVLARQCESALALAERWPIFLLNYYQLPEVVWDELVPSLGLELSPAEIERMREVATRDAKSPGRVFQEDSGLKQQAANAEIQALAERWVRPLYERLEEFRVAPAVTRSSRH